MKKILLASLFGLMFSSYAIAQEDDYSDDFESVETLSGSQPESSVEGDLQSDASPVLSQTENAVENNKESVLVESPLEKEMEDNAEKERQIAASDAAETVRNDKRGKGIRWIPVGISAAIAVGGCIAAYMFDKKAKDATKTPPTNEQEFKKGHDDAQKNQTVRNISLGVAAAGFVALGVSFLF